MKSPTSPAWSTISHPNLPLQCGGNNCIIFSHKLLIKRGKTLCSNNLAGCFRKRSGCQTKLQTQRFIFYQCLHLLTKILKRILCKKSVLALLHDRVHFPINHNNRFTTSCSLIKYKPLC